MIAIVDYGVGNLFSLKSSLDAVGVPSIVTADADILHAADKVILPGVGAFADAADKLRTSGLDKVVTELAGQGKPLMGICLGMQLLFEKSYEFGEHAGLGLIPGAIRPIRDVIPAELKIPHIGWNALQIVRESPLLQNVAQGDAVYFVHSYYAADCDQWVIATAEYGAHLTAAVQKDHVFGCQFHPEKSGKTGLAILKAFAQL